MTNEEVIELAKLARLKLSDEEVLMFQKQLTEIIGYIDQVRKFADQESYFDSNQSLVVNQMRNDDFIPAFEDNLLSQRIISLAPDKHQDYFKVPKVLDKNNDLS